MKMHLIIILAFLSQLLLCQERVSMSFDHYSHSEGLSNTTVYDIGQDSIGQLWFATADGLNLYNGSHFSVFRNNKRDSTSIQENAIRAIYFDSKSRMWIGTEKGVSRYDSKKARFFNYPGSGINGKMNVFDILELSGDMFLVATNSGLFSFSEQDGYRKLPSPDKTKVSKLLKFQHRILLGTDRGLFTYYSDSESYELTHEALLETAIMDMLPHSSEKSKLWIATEGDGLWLVDLSYKTYTHYKHEDKNPASLSSNYIRSISYDLQNRLWVGTFVGLNISTNTSGKFSRYYHDPYNPESISQSSIRSIMSDRQGGIWLGTYYGGVNYYHPLRSRFNNIRHKKGVNSLSDNVVSIIHCDNHNNLWIGTNEHGLNYYNSTLNEYTNYIHHPDKPYSITANNIKSILPSGNDHLLIGTHGGGLCSFNKSNKRFERIHISHSKTADNNIYTLARPNDQKVWIGTLDGLVIWDEASRQATPFTQDLNGTKLVDNQIMSLYVDTKGLIWIGTDNGVNRYNPQTKLFEIACSPEQNNRSICCFTEDKQGQIWIGTKSGLLRYDQKSFSFIDMSQTIDLPEIAIYGIQEDKIGRLWISTSSGLFVLNATRDKWISYTEQDGIQSDQFSMYSYCKDQIGRMYFGGINGITYFNPEKMPINIFSPTPMINNLKLFNKTVAAGDQTGILSQSLYYMREIKLQPKQSTFTLEFSVPNYISGNNNTFAYRLIGFQEEWVYTKQGSASYSNLKPGRYTFEVKAANNDGVWSDSTTTLSIIAEPQWWETWWAISLFICFIIATIAVGVNYYTDRKFIQRELHLERLEKQHNEAYNQSKIRFFINISHEFRTPLTLILSPLHEILSKGVSDSWIRSQLEHVQRNAKRMTHLINQVLDYRRSELGVLYLKVELKNINNDVKEIFELFTQITKSKGINYYFNSNITSQELYYDPNFLERILSNLISNAIKYTSADGTIDITIDERDKRLIIEVADTGCGIALEKQNLIFDRFFQVEESASGTGIGLSLVKNLVEIHHGEISLKSTPGEGSIFTVSLPCTLESYSSQEIVSTPLVAPTDSSHVIAEREIAFMEDRTAYEPPNLLSETIDSNKKILLVEDDDLVKSYLQEKFSECYKVLSAENGKEAIQILEQESDIDLIVSDVMMPIMDGIKLCKYVKHNINYSHIPVILLTAKTDLSAQLDGLQAGADDYISKPFIYAILQAKIINIFKVRGLLLQRYSSSDDADISQLATNTVDEEFLQKAISIIERHMENPEFSTEDFSREMGMSRSNLYIKLKALTNESAVVFIRRIRFSHACKLLKQGRYNVSEISGMVGFTPSYFASSFKKHMGCMPSEYIKKHKI